MPGYQRLKIGAGSLCDKVANRPAIDDLMSSFSF